MKDFTDLVGCKYKLHGRDENGFDCYGLVLEVEKRFNNFLPDFDYESYTNEYFNDKAVSVIKMGSALKVNSYCEGAILLFGKGLKDHIGVYIGDGWFIHCNKKGVHLEKVSLLKDKDVEIYIWQN